MITDTTATPSMNLRVMAVGALVVRVWDSKADVVWEDDASNFFLLFLLDGVEMVEPMSLDFTSIPSLISVELPPSTCKLKYRELLQIITVKFTLACTNTLVNWTIHLRVVWMHFFFNLKTATKLSLENDPILQWDLRPIPNLSNATTSKY